MKVNDFLSEDGRSLEKAFGATAHADFHGHYDVNRHLRIHEMTCLFLVARLVIASTKDWPYPNIA